MKAWAIKDNVFGDYVSYQGGMIFRDRETVREIKRYLRVSDPDEPRRFQIKRLDISVRESRV